jgi:hypothetical protein
MFLFGKYNHPLNAESLWVMLFANESAVCQNILKLWIEIFVLI